MPEMTFLTDLARLREAAVLHPSSLNDDELTDFLVNHAEAIEELVKAAETHYKMRTVASGQILGQALESLNRSK